MICLGAWLMIWGHGSFKLEPRDLLEFERRDFLFSGVLLRRDHEHRDFCIGFSWWLHFEIWACIALRSKLVGSFPKLGPGGGGGGGAKSNSESFSDLSLMMVSLR